MVDSGRLILVGETDPVLDGSLWAARSGHRGRGQLPAVDLDAAVGVADAVRELVNSDLVLGAHDVSQGGLALALAEMAVRGGVGCTVARVPDHAALFSESTGRVVLCVEADRVRAVLDVLEARGVAHSRIGVAGGDRLVVQGLLDLPLAAATTAWREQLPAALGGGTTQG
jgi:phosphoribosylformylglycinamidine synthase